MCAIFVTLILQFQAVILVKKEVNFFTKNLFKIPERAGVDKIHQKIFWNYISVLNWIHKMKKLLVNEKQPLFTLALTPILQDKKQTDNQNQNILHIILRKSMPF